MIPRGILGRNVFVLYFPFPYFVISFTFGHNFGIFQQVDKQQKVSSKQRQLPSQQEKEPLVEIPISIEVEKRDESLGETSAEKKRKQKREQFVSIQSIDETPMSTDDSGLPQIPSSKVGYYKYQITYS